MDIGEDCRRKYFQPVSAPPDPRDKIVDTVRCFGQINGSHRGHALMYIANKFDAKTELVTQVVEQTRNAFWRRHPVKVDAGRLLRGERFG